jgi:UDP-N-acetylglucosamine:LPS N-acetylglucosamine transferase
VLKKIIKKKRILFLFSNTGSGHLVSAHAIQKELEQQNQYDYEFKNIDFVGENSKFWNIFAVGYTPMIRYVPFVWGLLYKILMPDISLFFLEKSAALCISKGLEKDLKDFDPHLIVSVHPLVNHLITTILRKKKLDIPFVVVVTDPVTFHKSWLGCKRYIRIADKTSAAIVATKEGYERALNFGFPKEKLNLIGLPVRPEFYANKVPVRQNKKFTVLIMGGGEGAGKIYHILQALLRNKFSGRVIVICGNNDRLKNRLEKMRKKYESIDLIVKGYCPNIKNYMDESNILVTKAGPGTIAEAMSRELPIIVFYCVPGQEIGNADFIKTRNIGYVIKSPKLIALKIVELIEKPEELEKIRLNIRSIKPLGATKDIVKKISEYL